MKPQHLLPAQQLAWLNEIGVDTHWLAAQKGTHQAPAQTAPGAAAPPVDPSVAEANVDARPDAPITAPTLQCNDPGALARAVEACVHAVPNNQHGPAVPGDGVWPDPAYFIVGEQPGMEDEAAGRPFRGDQGRLLHAMLAAARLPQSESHYLTTLVKCRAVGGRTPEPEVIAACLPYLQQEIMLVRPRWILALGVVAARAILQSTADLDVLRESRHVWTGPDGTTIPVWVTHHPASLLVRSADKPAAWRDLVALAEAVRTAEP